MTAQRPQTWFTSDLHLGHALLARLRGFYQPPIDLIAAPDVLAHDARLATNWDRVINPGDTVWLLGDITLNNNPHAAINWLQARPGTKRLILGNHDGLFPAHRGARKFADRYGQTFGNTFASIQTFARIHDTSGTEVLLSHFPYPGTSEGTDDAGRPYDDRYAQYRLPNLGVPLIHGHTHRSEKLSYNNGTPQVHIGLDAWDLHPVSLHDIEEILRNA